jgi:hypothetical protein
MAAHFAAEGSPLYAELAERCADEPLAARLGAPPTFRLALSLFGGVHYLALAAELPAFPRRWEAFQAVLAERHGWLSRWVREQPVQTNEVQRCWALVPGFLAAVRALRWEGPLDLVELGPSAGLNLLWDRYCYRYGDLSWGPESPLVLEGEARDGPPAALLDATARVRGRLGIDLSPLDVGTEEGRRILLAFVWADQERRLERLRAALEVARELGAPELRRGDYVELLPGVLAERDPDALTVVFHSASTSYLDARGYARVCAAFEQAARDGRPLARVSLETPREEGATKAAHALEVQVWPGGVQERLARVGYHGEWLDWIA